MHLGQLPHRRIAGRGRHVRQRGGAVGHGEVPEILARDVKRRPRVTGQVLRLDAIVGGGDPDQPARPHHVQDVGQLRPAARPDRSQDALSMARTSWGSGLWIL